VKKLAIWTLGFIGTEDHIPLLLGQLVDFDDDIRTACHEALLSVGSRHLDDLLRQYGNHG
jgi:HEAT repeat protein